MSPKPILGWARGSWEADGYIYFQSATEGLAGLPSGAGSFLIPVPGFVSIDARLAYRLNDSMTLAISGQNLGVSPQQQTSGPKIERSVLATLTVNY
jgi:iron complex outermembrane receptor protein